MNNFTVRRENQDQHVLIAWDRTIILGREFPSAYEHQRADAVNDALPEYHALWYGRGGARTDG